MEVIIINQNKIITDKSEAIKYVSQDSDNLQYCSNELKNDEEVVGIAVIQSPLNILYANKRFQSEQYYFVNVQHLILEILHKVDFENANIANFIAPEILKNAFKANDKAIDDYYMQQYYKFQKMIIKDPISYKIAFDEEKLRKLSKEKYPDLDYNESSNRIVKSLCLWPEELKYYLNNEVIAHYIYDKSEEVLGTKAFWGQFNSDELNGMINFEELDINIMTLIQNNNLIEGYIISFNKNLCFVSKDKPEKLKQATSINSNRKDSKMASKVVYDMIKDKIISRLEEAEKNGEKFNWVKPWNGGPNSPISYQSCKRYRGINAVMLEPGEYLTFKQIQALQAYNPDIKLSKGSKSEQVFFYTQTEKKDEEGNIINDRSGKPIMVPVLRYYNVFNVNDVDGLNPRFEIKRYEHTPDENMKAADKYIKEFCDRTNLKLEINNGSNRAYYSPTEHKVSLPDKSQFESQYEYYSTVFHELAHSTGKALERPIENGFGTEKYSKEELVAEISSQMLCNTFGIIDDRTEDNSIAYIQGWSGRLTDEKSYVIASACIQAQKACDLIAEEYYKDYDLENDPVPTEKNSESHLEDKISNATKEKEETQSKSDENEKPKSKPKKKAKDDQEIL